MTKENVNCGHTELFSRTFMGSHKWEPCLLCERDRLRTDRDRLLASLKEMGDWLSAGLQAPKDAWPDAKCLQHTKEIFSRARAAADAAEAA